MAREIPFQSLCMHHVLPFHGVAHIAHPPRERILRLSKLARVVELDAGWCVMTHAPAMSF